MAEIGREGKEGEGKGKELEEREGIEGSGGNDRGRGSECELCYLLNPTFITARMPSFPYYVTV